MIIRRFSLLLLLVAALSTTLFLACRRGEQSATDAEGTPTTGDWAVIRLGSDPDTFNPIITQSADGREIGGLTMYESLIGTDNETLQEIPMLAESLAVVSPDHLSYTFRLRKNVTYSDGHPCTGEDFVFALKCIKNPLIINAAPLRSYFQKVKEIELVNGDPYVLKFVMTEPYFLANQFCSGVQPLPRHIWDPKGLMEKISFADLANIQGMKNNPIAKEFAEWFDDPAKGRDPKFLIATGKYIFESWATGDKIMFRRNDHYWNASDKKMGVAWLDKIVYKTIADDNAAITALKGGEIDFIPNVPKMLYVNAFDSIRDKHIKHQTYVFPSMSYIAWNLHNPTFQDVRVRRALAKLVNTEEIMKTILKGYAVQVTGSEFFKRPEYDTTIKPWNYDPDGAKKLLEEAGWKDADGDGVLEKDGRKFEFTFLSTNSAISDKILLIPIESMRKVGIKAEIQHLEFAVFIQNLRDHKFEATFGSWATSAQEGDPYQTWHSSQIVGGSNSGYYNNPEVDKLIETMRGEFDAAKRLVIHKKIQQIIFDDQPYAFLYSVKLAGAWNARLKHVKFYPPRPCFDYTEWFVPKEQQKYKN
jgi:peptide/nickel transport system substrate-binding protein